MSKKKQELAMLKNLHRYLHKYLPSTFLAVTCLIPLAIAAPTHSATLSVADLIKTLQTGGHIIYMRHGPTERTQRDTDRKNFENCQGQRNLSEQGRKQMTQVGKSIRALNIPIGEVISSPYCRCKDSARLAFGEFKIETNLQFSISKDKEESKQLGEQLHAMMMNADPGAKNIVFVGHTANLKDGVGVWPKPEGVVAIFQRQKDKIIFKGMIKPGEWPNP